MEDKYLITGATGFIGSCLTRELVKQKKDVNIIVRSKDVNWRLGDIKQKLNIYECDLRDDKLLSQIVDKIKPTYIFHLAAYGSLPTENDIYDMIDINIKGTSNLINALKKNKFKLLINTGSSSEYGIKNSKMNEKDILEPINNYGISKASATVLAQKEAKINSLPVINFRLFSPYGSYEDKSRFIPFVILSALKNKSISLNNPHNVRDFLYVGDVVQAYLQAITISAKFGEIYNIGSGSQHTTENVVNTIVKLLKSSSVLEWGKVKNQQRQIEPSLWEADTSKAERELSWKATTSLENGLLQTLNWFKENIMLYE